jgi:predicted phage tail protein
MLRKIKLYGDLATFIGHKEFEVKADTLGHAVSFLVNNFEGIDKYMNPKYYQVKVGDYAVNEEEIHHPIGQQDIHFVPVIQGAGGNTGKTLLGAALIAVGMGAFGAFAGKAVSFGAKGIGFGKAAFGAKAAFGIGAGLVLSGVSDMLFPLPVMPEFKSEQDPRISFGFSGTSNTSRAGTPVPICYGEIITGSVVISGAVDTQQVQA